MFNWAKDEVWTIKLLDIADRQEREFRSVVSKTTREHRVLSVSATDTFPHDGALESNDQKVLRIDGITGKANLHMDLTSASHR
jgi:hypothetical protein